MPVLQLVSPWIVTERAMNFIPTKDEEIMQKSREKEYNMWRSIDVVLNGRTDSDTNRLFPNMITDNIYLVK